jgi:hypothetical protein
MMPVSVIPPYLFLAGGAVLGWLQNFWSQLYNRTIGQVVQRVMVCVTVEEMDHAEAWVWLQFWAEKRLRERRISTLTLRRKSHRNTSSSPAIGGENNESGYEIAPSYGTYPFKWRKRYLLVFNSGKEEQATNGASPGLSSFMPPLRKVTVTIWGTRDRELLLQIIWT